MGKVFTQQTENSVDRWRETTGCRRNTGCSAMCSRQFMIDMERKNISVEITRLYKGHILLRYRGRYREERQRSRERDR